MRAMVLRKPVMQAKNPEPLEIADVPRPQPSRGELLVRVSVCGVCRTDLDVAEGRVVAPRYPVIPGHQVIGRVEGGRSTHGIRAGDRVGIAWINWADGVCAWCQS